MAISAKKGYVNVLWELLTAERQAMQQAISWFRSGLSFLAGSNDANSSELECILINLFMPMILYLP